MVSTEVDPKTAEEIELCRQIDADIDLLVGVVAAPVGQVLRFFKCSHLPLPLRSVSAACGTTALSMAHRLSGAELTVGLRKLLEAKDAFVRAALP